MQRVWIGTELGGCFVRCSVLVAKSRCSDFRNGKVVYIKNVVMQRPLLRVTAKKTHAFAGVNRTLAAFHLH
jgi:hypothetical protein